MSDIKDGGPAFPQQDRVLVTHVDSAEQLKAIADALRHAAHPGMSLRDYFAAKALSAIMRGDHVDGQGDPERHATLAYWYADAMLAAREQS